jgi:predicted Zn-ribbon and HTH transcriptional regulator
VKYGPFMKHMKHVHKSNKKGHYRAVVKPERCVVCGDEFPNLHNHYRAHLQNQCQLCCKYFTSAKVFSLHSCDKDDSDPSKVFVSDENLLALINSYIPQDLKDDEKFYGSGDECEEDVVNGEALESELKDSGSQDSGSQNGEPPASMANKDNLSQDEKDIHLMVSSPIISDVLSLYQQKEDKKPDDNDKDVVMLTDDDSMDVQTSIPIITID